MADPAPLEIWQVVGFPVGNSVDVRPCVVLSVLPDGDINVAPLSANLALRGPSWKHFGIDSEHPDFPATGLTKSCYVLTDYMGPVERRQLMKRRGKLQGEIARAFAKWI